MNNNETSSESFRQWLLGGPSRLSIPSLRLARTIALLALAPCFLALLTSSAQAQLTVKGQLLIDFNAARGTLTGTGLNNAGDNGPNLTNWINYGTLSGAFNAVNNSAYAAPGFNAAQTNPPEMVLQTDASGGPNNGVSATVPTVPVNQRMMVASFLTPAQMLGSNPWSVECWFYEISDAADPRGLFGWTLAAPASGDAGEISSSTTAYWAGSAADANDLTWVPSGVVGTVSAAAPSLSAWHYSVLTYDGTTLSVYLDGSLSNSAPRALNINSTIDPNPVIFSQLGAFPAIGTSSSYNGAMAALRVHTGVLSAADVANNYAQGINAVGPVDHSLYVTAGPVTAISGTPGTPNSGTATLNANLVATADSASTSVTLYYDTTDHGQTTVGWAHSVTLSAPQVVGALSTSLSSLPFSTTYYVRAYATNINATNWSGVVSFKTVGPPTISNSGACYLYPQQDVLLANLTQTGDGTASANVTVFWGPTDGNVNGNTWANVVNLGSMIVGQVQMYVGGLNPLGQYYFTFAAQGGFGSNYLTTSSAFQEGLLFSVNPATLPAASAPPAAATPVASWPSSAGTFLVGAGGGGGADGTPTSWNFGGQQWLSTTASPIDDNLWLPLAAWPGGVVPTSLPINGATVIATVKPTGANGNPWGNIVSVFFSQIGLATSPTTATLPANSVASITVKSGGSGYSRSSPPTVTIAGPGGTAALDSAATAVAQVSSSGSVTNIVVTSGGSGYPVVGGGANGNTAGTLYATSGFGPPVTIAPPTSGTTATATAALTPTACVELLADVNSERPVDVAGGPGAGRNVRSGVYLPLNQVSVVSLVAGSGDSSGVVGDNNYIMYVNGIKVLDTDFGFITGVNMSPTGSGYTNAAGVNLPPTVTFPPPTAPGGTQATGTAIMGTGANLGQVTGVTVTYAGSGYTGNGIVPTAYATTGNPVVTFSAPLTVNGFTGTTAAGVASCIPLGDYNPVAGATTVGALATGYNGGNMTTLNYNTVSYAGNSTYCLGQDALNIDPWSGYQGYIGDVYVYGEILPAANRQSLEAAEVAKFVTGATKSFAISTSIGNGTITGPSTVVQGFNATYSFLPTVGYAISGVTVDGVPVGTVTAYTFTDVSATHSIVVTTIPVPPQNITVTYGAGGTILTNGVVMATGANWANITGGTSPAFTLTVNPGYQLGVIKVDGVTLTNTTILAAGGIYTFANIGGNGSGPSHTLNVTFIALPSGTGIASTSVASVVPESEYLFFSVDTASLPQSPLFTGPTPITNWPMYYSSIGVKNMVQNAGGGAPAHANTLTDANGVVWEQNVDGLYSGTTTGYQFYTGAVGAATGTTIPNNGATIVTVINPTRNQSLAGQFPFTPVVDVMFGCVELSVTPDTGLIQAIVDNDLGPYDGVASPIATSTYAIPNGSNTVLSLVVQPNGSFAVYANTVEVITNAGLGPLYITAGVQAFTFANNIDIGDDGPDGPASFNGLIGNTYFWTTALSTSERTNLEAALMTEFHAVVPPSFNWVGPDGGNWSSVANWSNTVPFAVNTVPGTGGGQTAVFSLETALPLPGLSVNLDLPEQLFGLNFNTSAVISSAAGYALTLGDGTGAGAITVTAGSPAIEVPLNLVGELTTTVSGSGTLTLANDVTLNGYFNAFGPGTVLLGSNVNLAQTTTSYLQVAPNGSSTAAVTIAGGTFTTYAVAQSWSQANGPGVMLGGADNSATSATLNLNGGTLVTPNIGCVTENSTPVLVPPSADGATAIVNLNGGVLQASDNDSRDGDAISEGSAHLIFNTTHTYVGGGGAFINTAGFNNSIAVPLEHSPAAPVIDGGLTKMGTGTLSNLYAATYTGPTVVQQGILEIAQATGLGINTLTISPGAQLQPDYAGTAQVYQLNLNGANVVPGVYGSTASGAAHADDTDFVPGTKGTVTVLGAVVTGNGTPNITSNTLTGSIGAGTGRLNLVGTGGIKGLGYKVLGSTNVAASISTWTVLSTGTFTSAGFSVSIPVSASTPEEFFTIVVP